ncbi:PA3496 family putative envelope integrity protein [Sulfuriflexus mobilis]|uniref:PA3496 family putative envelope integrity protein n=1 Tax=Sulfuriflexus mobilis TaxID=1811807 RepID=UPI000F829029|nr:hypothetical protein [Sulfuriflexus mobilis]
MSRINDYYDEAFPEDMEQLAKNLDRKETSGKKRLKARRKIEDIREQRRLKRQLDFYGTDG